MDKLKRLPVGIEGFAEIQENNFYYVDKTNLIRDLLHNWGKVNLFTRPRRFGKSLNINMLKCFFEIGCDRTLFEGLNIMLEKELCDSYMGKFPVIMISLKGAGGMNFDDAKAMICSVIGNEALRFQFLYESPSLSDIEKKQYRALINIDETGRFTMSTEVLVSALFTLSRLLFKHYGQKTIILIDEYDVPLDKAFQGNFYEPMVKLIRDIFIQALKGNEYLLFSVLTGCLRISKESIFTGLNNPKIFSVTSSRFSEYFGFSDEEVKELLTYFDLSDHYETIRAWYDGYRFGHTDVYCPWDVLSYCDDLLAERDIAPANYWSNTSDNSIIRHFIEKAGRQTKDELEELIAGNPVEKELHQELTYGELYDSIDNLWSVLFTTGYLTSRGQTENGLYRLSIPNREIRSMRPPEKTMLLSPLSAPLFRPETPPSLKNR